MRPKKILLRFAGLTDLVRTLGSTSLWMKSALYVRKRCWECRHQWHYGVPVVVLGCIGSAWSNSPITRENTTSGVRNVTIAQPSSVKWRSSASMYQLKTLTGKRDRHSSRCITRNMSALLTIVCPWRERTTTVVTNGRYWCATSADPIALISSVVDCPSTPKNGFARSAKSFSLKQTKNKKNNWITYFHSLFITICTMVIHNFSCILLFLIIKWHLNEFFSDIQDINNILWTILSHNGHRMVQLCSSRSGTSGTQLDNCWLNLRSDIVKGVSAYMCRLTPLSKIWHTPPHLASG